MEVPEARHATQLEVGPPSTAVKAQLLGYVVMVVCLVVFLVYMPALSTRAEFQDDQLYVLDNPLVQNPSWASVRRFFGEVFRTSSPTGYYLPLTMTSLMVDRAISGQTRSLRVFHRTSLLLHVANAGLILVLLYRLFGNPWAAAGMALLFGLHPLTVDSVCWLSERKTVLAAFFSLWSLILYVRFAQTDKRRFMAGSTVAYVLALLAKPIALPLPAVMLLLDYWPLRRLSRRAVVEKAVLFILAIMSGWITVVSQNSTAGSMAPTQYGLMKVPLIVCHDVVFYLAKIAWPAKVSAFYYHPQPPSFGEPLLLAGVLVVLLLAVVLIVSFRWARGPLICTLIFLTLLLPAMQIISVTSVLVANRYVYLPSLGVLLGLAAGMVRVLRTTGPRWRTVAAATLGGVLLCAAAAEATATRRYLSCWQDTVGLYRYMLRIMPEAGPLYIDLGIAFSKQGKAEEAIGCYRKALELDPHESLAHFDLGVELAKSKDNADVNEAIVHYREALGHRLVGNRACLCLALLLKDRGQTGEAIKLMNTALRMNPEEFRAHLSLGETLPLVGQSREGIFHLREAIRLAPTVAPAVTDLAWLLATHTDPNIRDCNGAVALGKRAVYLAGLVDARPFDSLAAAYASKGDFDLAVETAERAVKTAERLKQAELLGKIRQRLELYRQGRPYFEDPARQNNVADPNAVPAEGCYELDALAFMEDPNS